MTLALLLWLALPATAGSLEQRWLGRVEAAGKGRERLRAALGNLLKSPTARPLAEALLRTEGRVSVRLADLGARKSDGRWEGSTGRTHRGSDPIVVEVHAGLEALEPDLAHELLGHVSLALEARRRGVFEALMYLEDDERRATLIAALVARELGVEDSGAEPERALTAEAFRSMLYSGELTALRMSLEELPRSHDVLTARLASLPGLEAEARALGKDHWLALYSAGRGLLETAAPLHAPGGEERGAVEKLLASGIPARLRRECDALAQNLLKSTAKGVSLRTTLSEPSPASP